MTVEQLRNQQNDLNSRLLRLLQNLSCSVTRLTGDFSSTPQTEFAEYPIDGLISDIQVSQQKGLDLINQLNECADRLNQHVFAPEQAKITGN
jgi:response regulator RpfG family c-di-GMP phosphodiesterase